MIRIWFFHSCIPRPPWFYLLFRPWVTTERDWNGETLRRQNLQHLVSLLGIEHQEELGCIPEPWLQPASPASVYSPFHPHPPPYWLSSCWSSFHSLNILCSSWPLHLCIVFLCPLHMHFFFFLPGVIFTITLPFPILLPINSDLCYKILLKMLFPQGIHPLSHPSLNQVMSPLLYT